MRSLEGGCIACLQGEHGRSGFRSVLALVEPAVGFGPVRRPEAADIALRAQDGAKDRLVGRQRGSAGADFDR
jgi:hypothetical protein